MTAIDLIPPTYSRGLGSPAATATRVSSATVVCETCGCRLTTRESADDAGFRGDRSWFHFVGPAGRDARGCAVACADAAHQVA
ncbi:MAG TPA: hypothetical protein VER83_01045 [Candidatus Nanopelagicales bacterium]|nr:hypothetical protein [Candidatus Nanopelagicales bacterium]